MAEKTIYTCDNEGCEATGREPLANDTEKQDKWYKPRVIINGATKGVRRTICPDCIRAVIITDIDRLLLEGVDGNNRDGLAILQIPTITITNT